LRHEASAIPSNSEISFVQAGIGVKYFGVDGLLLAIPVRQGNAGRSDELPARSLMLIDSGFANVLTKGIPAILSTSSVDVGENGGIPELLKLRFVHFQ
jgi:hypothetical protein